MKSTYLAHIIPNVELSNEVFNVIELNLFLNDSGYKMQWTSRVE